MQFITTNSETGIYSFLCINVQTTDEQATKKNLVEVQILQLI